MGKYTIIENTPGYLPEDDDPPIFDSYAEALNELQKIWGSIADVDIPTLAATDNPQPRYRVEPILNGQFSYYDNELNPSRDLGRSVEIVPVDEDDNDPALD